MKALIIKIIEAIFCGIFSLLLIMPLTLIYSFGVGVFSFGSNLINELDELITYNKSIWK